MDKKYSKTKDWFVKHKNAIETGIAVSICSVTAVSIVCFGYRVGEAAYASMVGRDLRYLWQKGFIKFFDPKDGLEVDITKAYAVIQKYEVK